MHGFTNSAANWYINCAFRDRSMNVGMQLEQVLRSIFGYRGVSKIDDGGRKFGISYLFAIKNTIQLKNAKFHVQM